MSSRRKLIQDAIAMLAGVYWSQFGIAEAATERNVFLGEEVFTRILGKARDGNWSSLPIGELMGKIAQELEGTPYKSNTLELSVDKEICSVNMLALDCVTFFEITMDFARMLKKGGKTPAALLKEIAFTRYRSGRLGDYTSRLHYTTDWFADNEMKHTVQLLSQLPGSEVFTKKVSLMSAHSGNIPQLRAHPALVQKIKSQENIINARSLKYVPLNKLAQAEPHLKTGDIVGICTDQPDLDISHTGLVFRSDDGVAHFMDASSRKTVMKVTLEAGPISEYLSHFRNAVGAMFARPLEPRT